MQLAAYKKINVEQIRKERDTYYLSCGQIVECLTEGGVKKGSSIGWR